MKQIIALTGTAGSGKDTVADHLCRYYGFARYAFARPLREEVAKAYGLGPSEVAFLEGRGNKEVSLLSLALEHCRSYGFIGAVLPPNLSGPQIKAELEARRSYRWVLQKWGTEYRRAQNERYWLERAADFVAGCNSDIVITDCRFPNEAEFVRGVGGKLWHIRRRGVQSVNAHTSETPLPLETGDVHLPNQQTISVLHENVDRIMRGECVTVIA